MEFGGSPFRRVGLPALICAVLLAAGGLYGQELPGGLTNAIPNPLLTTWSFSDTTNWTSDSGYPPLSFENIAGSPLGNGTSVLVDSPSPAWLQFNIVESNGATNLPVDEGAVILWFAPNWSSVSQGGTGPGDWARLLEVGDTNGAGWWSLYLDPDGDYLYFSAQTNGGIATTYLSVPVSWTTNYWHGIALSYSATNTSLSLDGALATDGPGLSTYPGPEVLTNGFFIGSDSSGNSQAHGVFDDIETYGMPANSGTVAVNYLTELLLDLVNPLNTANRIPSAPFTPSTNAANVVAGLGFMQDLGSSGSGVTSSNVWLTGMSCTPSANGGMTIRFSIAGGTNGALYDVFATGALVSPIANGVWAWMGQGATGHTYQITNKLSGGGVFFMLGTPKDTDGDLLTDAFEMLYLHSNPQKADTDGDGVSDSVEFLGGSDPTNPYSKNGVPDGYQDYDGDGLANLMEAAFGCNPLTAESGWKTDRDGDGLPDSYETMLGMDPATPSVAPTIPSNYDKTPL